ncbi:Hypothetical predicted protein [Marmota monax]|uniref:Cadherin domain-containing protein n=1 Tax=Marmota monax TaxID=9995 RepID=A0A5E4AUX1_MARMO|nr:Hypothetical predicted protein [Marmota monax]
MTAAKMGAQALRWPPLLLVLLTVLLGHSPGATAQTQVCSVDKTFLQVQENANITEALVNISVPEGQQVTLGSSSTPSAFRILGNQLFLSVIPDYEENTMLEAHLECKRGDTVVTQLRVFVVVLDVNDNAPEFPFTTKEQDVQEDTKVNSTVIPEAELQATDRDKDSTLFYTLQEVSPGAGSFFSLLGVNRPALRLDRALDFYKWQNMTFRLLVRVSGSPSCVLDAQAGPVGGPLPDTAELLQDTREEHREPSHTATATLVLKVLPADLRPPWFLPCSYSDGAVCIQAHVEGEAALSFLEKENHGDHKALICPRRSPGSREGRWACSLRGPAALSLQAAAAAPPAVHLSPTPPTSEAPAPTSSRQPPQSGPGP